MKRINFLWINDRDVHYSTDGSNLAYVESSGRGNARPNFPPHIWDTISACFAKFHILAYGLTCAS